MFRMIQGPTALLAGGLWVLTVGASAQGVQAGASGTSATAQVAPAAALAPGQTATSATGLAALNQVTIADLVAGFQQFLSQVGQTPAAGSQAALAPEQQQQIQGLQAQLDGEEINEEAFAAQMHSIIGNAAPAQRFGVLGAPLFQEPAAGTSDPLNLTAEQQQQAQDISTRLHDDIAQLRQEAHDLILSVLTADQQAKLSGTSSGQPAQPARPSTAKTRVQGVGLRSHGTNVGVPGGGTKVGGQSTASGVGAQNAGSGAPLQNPFDSLQLTDAQKAEIELIRADLRVAVQARHQQARDEFFAILAPDQQALLYELEQMSGSAASAVSAGGQ